MYAILDLFSGIGGFSLGLHRASDKFYTTAFCEIEDFCQAVLKKNFKNIPIFKDVKELNEKTLKAAGAVKPFIVTGGYPCQPFSVAGRKRGKDDPRNIWSEMFRLIKELKPVWVLAENVEGHIKLGLDEVLYDLESQNYTTQTFIIPATSVGANHQRKRLWIVGYSQHNGLLAAMAHSDINRWTKGRCKKYKRVEKKTSKMEKKGSEPTQTIRCSSTNGKADVAHSGKFNSNERKYKDTQKKNKKERFFRCKTRRKSSNVGENWNIEPNVGRVANGISFRVDRLKAIGNSIVPQIAEIIGKAIITQEEE